MLSTPARRLGAALALYTLLALLLTWPLVLHLTTHVPGDGIDDPALAWNLWWLKLRLVDQLNPDIFHSGWMFSPVGINLAFYTLTPLNGLLSVPLQLAFGGDAAGNAAGIVAGIVASNVLLLSSFVLSGLGAYLVVRYLLGWLGWCTANRRAAYVAALLAGGLYAFASAKLFYAALGQFNIASSQWIPFCVLYLLHLVNAGSRRDVLRAGALAGLFLVLQAWAELTYASFLLIFVALLLLWRLIAGPPAGSPLRRTADTWQVLAGFVVAGLIFVGGMLPFLWAMAPDLRAEGDFFGAGGGFADVFSADLLGFLLPTRLHPLFGAFVAGLPFPNDKGQHLFLGYGVLLLMGVGLWVLWRQARRWAWLWGAATVLFWLLTLGPQVRWAGQATPLPGPFALVSLLPFFSGNRYPSRYSVMLLLAAAVLAGAGLWWLLSRAWVQRRPWLAPMVAVLLTAVIGFEHLSVPLPLSDLRIPPIYARLAQEVQHATASGAPASALLELPTGWRNGARVLGLSDLLIMQQQWYQTAHGLPRLGGNTSRNPAFKFQYFTDAPLLGDLIALMNAGQPHIAAVVDPGLDAMIDVNRRVAPQVLDFLGIDFVTVQVEKTSAQLLRLIDEALPLALVAESQDIDPSTGDPRTLRLYRVTSAPAAAADAAALRIDMAEPLANLYLGAGWSAPLAGASERFATRPTPELLVHLPAGGKVVLAWAAPIAGLRATLDGLPVTAAPVGGDPTRWQVDVPATTGAGALPVRSLQLHLAGGAQSPNFPPAAIGATGATLPSGATLFVRSAGEEVGDFAQIWLNGVDVSLDRRGYNLAAISPDGTLLDKAVFDTFAAPAASADLSEWLGRWPAGTIIAGAVRDEASLQLGQPAVDALATLGVANDLRGKFRWSHAFIGAVGAPPGSALEQASLLHPAGVAAGAALDAPALYGSLRGLEFTPAE